MFSEYASKFLQQSQTRMSAIREGRLTTQTPAPLFHSAADFLPEDLEHEQEVQDFYALKSSRRHFGPYAPSSATGAEEDEDNNGEYSDEDSTQELRRSRGRSQYLGLGNIKSSWRAPGTSDSAFSNETISPLSLKGKDKMVPVRLDESEVRSEAGKSDRSAMVGSAEHTPFAEYDRRRSDSLNSDYDSHHPPDDIAIKMPRDESPPSFQQFKRPHRESSPSLPFAAPVEEESRARTPFMPQESEQPKAQPQTIPQQVYHPVLEPPTHDKLWGSLYTLLMACMFTTSFIVWLHTEDHPTLPGDTIYKTLHSSFHLLTVDTFVAIAISLLWMYLLKSFVKPLIYVLVVAVPMVLVAFSIYPFVMSFKAPGGGYGGQVTVMRWGSFIPAIMSVAWIYTAWKSRHAMTRAVGIIQLACRIIGENATLVLLSFGTLVVTCVFTWVWVGMFTRVFLTGNMLVGGKWNWMLSSKTIALGIYYIMMYLWTLGVASGVHRATSAATVSQWYFHRHAIPTPSSQAVMSAALHHASTTLFGSICFSAFLALLVRLPLLIAPRRFVGIIHLLCFQFVASPIAALINPLTLTYAAIHSQPLLASSRAVLNLKFVDTSGYGRSHHPRVAYRFSKMLLTAARTVAAMSLGIGAWVASARNVDGGSVYGYLVGLIAGCIGWCIIGATESCLGNVVDATLVCVGSEGGGGTHCREAQLVFGG